MLKTALIIYLIVSSTYGGFVGHSFQTDSDKQAYYFLICALVGSLILPIKALKGFKKIYHEGLKERES